MVFFSRLVGLVIFWFGFYITLYFPVLETISLCYFYNIKNFKTLTKFACYPSTERNIICFLAIPPTHRARYTHTLSSHVHLLMHTRSLSHTRKSEPRTGRWNNWRCARHPQGGAAPTVEAAEDGAAGDARAAASGSLLAEAQARGPPGHWSARLLPRAGALWKGPQTA